MSIYKGYDIRGTVPDEINDEFASKLGAGFAQYIASLSSKTGNLSILVARDNRATSQSLSEHVISSLRQAGVDVIDIGLAPTPVFYFGVDSLEADGGIMITASHNPPQFNGFKLVREKAIPIGLDSGLKDIQTIIESSSTNTSDLMGQYQQKEVMQDYIAMHTKLLGAINASPLRVAVDTGNGVSVLMIKPYLESLSTNIVPLYFEMDGTFPNHEPNPLKYENIKDLCNLVLEQKADCGIALDADGDRVIFVDEQGTPVSSDDISCLVATQVLNENKNATILYDIRSSHAVRDTIEHNSGTAQVTRVGHAYIKETMRKTDAAFTGELSGHFYFKATNYYEAPLLVVGMVLKTMLASKASLSEIVAPYHIYSPSGEINFEVADKAGAIDRLKTHYESAEHSTLEVDGITLDFGTWWFNVRPSNTENLLRLNLEANTPELMKEKLAEVTALITQ